MKKTIQKMITVILTVLIIFNFVYSNYVPVYAASDVINNVINVVVNLFGGVLAYFAHIITLPAMAIALAVNILTAQVAYMDGATPGSDVAEITITPFEIFFNEVQILDVNFLDIDVSGSSDGDTTRTIREAVAKWYYVMRLIAIAILLLILLYVGIRMAISSVASDKALYKKSLIDWSVSLALVFLLQYIIMFTVNANSAIVSALKIAVTNDNVGDSMGLIALTALGFSWESMAATVVYCMLVFQTFVFVVRYMKRMLTIAFLIIISPLISITYSIDKMGDGKAQALNTWLKEFVYNVLIQPFHCIMYLAFVDVAFKLLTDGVSSLWDGGGIALSNGIANGIIAIMCIKFIDDGEKIIRKIFGFEQASSLSPLETAAMAGVITQGGKMAVGAVTTGRKAINFAKEKGLTASIRKDIGNFKDRKKISEKTKELMAGNSGMTKAEAKRQATNEISTARENARNEKIENKKKKKDEKREEKVQSQMKKNLGTEAYNKLVAGKDTAEGKEAYENAHNEASQQVAKRANRGKTITGAIGRAWNSNTGRYIRNTAIPAGIGLALGSMAYGAGNVGAFTAFGAGKAAYQGASEFQKTSSKNIANEATTYMDGKASNDSEAREHMQRVYQNGENGAFESKSDETKDLIKRLEAILEALGEKDKLGQIKSQISYDMLQNPEKFDLNSILSNIVGADKAQNSDLYDAAKGFADHQSDSNLYNQLKNATTIGLSLDTIMDMITSRMDYSMAERSPVSNPVPLPENNTETNSEHTETVINNQNPDAGNDSDTQEPLKVDVHNIVEHIQRVENIEEVIHRVQDSELDTAMRNIDDHLDALNRVRLSDQTDEIKEQIRKFEQASRKIQEEANARRISNNEGAE